MKKLMVILLVLAVGGNAFAQQIYFENFESGFVNGADVARWVGALENPDGNVNWGEMPMQNHPGDMTALDNVGYANGDETWGLETTTTAYGNRHRIFGEPLTTGRYELRALTQINGIWSNCRIS